MPWVASAALLLFLLASPAPATSWEAGVSALQEGHLEKAASLFKRLAPQGDLRAQFVLGIMYLEGKGIEKDPEHAARWIQRSARAGFVPSQTLLGRMKLLGIGVPVDAAEALEWYRGAAGYGDPRAQGSLGVLYDRGLAGLPVNPLLAAQWYALAAKHGNSDAAKHLERVQANLSPEQRAAVERFAAAWKPTQQPKTSGQTTEEAARKLGEELGLDSIDIVNAAAAGL